MKTTFRVAATASALMAGAQALIAGNFLSGHYGALSVHGITAGLLLVTTLITAVLAVVRRLPRQVLMPSLLLPVMIAVQAVLGVFRVLTLHVPVGVLMVLGTINLAAWAWGPESAAALSRRGDAPPESAEPVEPAGVAA